MVWGLEKPSGFGMFFPHGDYPGFKERLEDYWRNEMPEEEKKKTQSTYREAYFHYVASKYSHEIGATIPLDGPVLLTPSLPHERPVEFRTEKTVRELGSLIMLNSQLLAVDEPLKGLIERLEPGRHQFWPIRITGPKGVDYPTRYYGMLPQFLDSFRPELSDAKAWKKWSGSENYLVTSRTKEACAELAISEDAIGDAHLWRDRRLRDPYLFISDTLLAEIKQAGLKVWKQFKLKSV